LISFAIAEHGGDRSAGAERRDVRAGAEAKCRVTTACVMVAMKPPAMEKPR
jgi:hypothetical protein